MKLNVLLVLGFASIAVGCAEKQEAAPEAAIPDEAAVAEEPAPIEPAFLAHMHLHAEQLDALNFALEDGDLEAARTPAYWLSKHDTVEGVDAELSEFLYGMRIAAEEAESAEDLETARTAAAKIGAACKGCHDAAGVDKG